MTVDKCAVLGNVAQSSLVRGKLMNYDNLQEAAKQLAVPLERWLEASGNEVMREDIGALKLANWDARVDFESGEILETGLTYWAANTRSGLRCGMSPSKESAREDALSALAETF
jgi:hypothetical protein